MLLNANEWNIPHAIDTIFLLLSLFMSLGAGEKIVPPKPKDPKFPFPKAYNVPYSVMMILCSFPLFS